MGKANHLRPIHTGGTTSITTVGQTAENMASHLDRQWPQDWRNKALPRILCAGYAGCIMTRRRSSGKPARPYIWRLTVLILLTVPSTLPELYGRLSPLRTASLS